MSLDDAVLSLCLSFKPQLAPLDSLKVLVGALLALVLAADCILIVLLALIQLPSAWLDCFFSDTRSM